MQLDQILPNIYLGTCPKSITDIDWMQRRPCDPSIEAIEKAVWSGGGPSEANSTDDPK